MAAALNDRGYAVVQVEMSDRPLDTARGDHLQCVVLEILEQWGVLDAFWAAGAEKRHGAIYRTDRSETILEVSYGSLAIPHPYFAYLHHELIGDTFLSEAAKNPHYILFKPARAREFDIGPEGVRSLTIALPDVGPVPEGFANGQRVTIKPRMVVGADGRSSRVREALGFTYDEHDYDSPIVVCFGKRVSPDEDPLNRVVSFMGPNGSISRIPRAFGNWKVGATIRKSDIHFWKTATEKMRKRAIAMRAPELESLDLEVAGFYPVKLLNTHEWVRGNTVLVGDACHAMHPARGQGMNVAIRCLAKLADLLPDVGEMADADIVARRLKAYERGVKPAIDQILAANHARGAETDSLDPDIIAKATDRMRAVADDQEKRRHYCMQAAGYADPLGLPSAH